MVKPSKRHLALIWYEHITFTYSVRAGDVSLEHREDARVTPAKESTFQIGKRCFYINIKAERLNSSTSQHQCVLHAGFQDVKAMRRGSNQTNLESLDSSVDQR